MEAIASTSSIIHTSSNITLEEEEDGGIIIEVNEGTNENETYKGLNTKLYFVGRFISEGMVDFRVMQHIWAVIWKPRRGVFIKEIEANLFLF